MTLELSAAGTTSCGAFLLLSAAEERVDVEGAVAAARVGNGCAGRVTWPRFRVRARARWDCGQSFKCGVISEAVSWLGLRATALAHLAQRGPCACNIVYVFLNTMGADVGPPRTRPRIERSEIGRVVCRHRDSFLKSLWV